MVPTAPLLSAEDVAQLLGVTPRTVHRLASAGELHRIVLGHRTTRYAADEVEAFIRRSTVPSTSEGPAGNGTSAKTREAARDRAEA